MAALTKVFYSRWYILIGKGPDLKDYSAERKEERREKGGMSLNNSVLLDTLELLTPAV